MDKRGIVFLYYLMIGLTIIILGIALAYPTKAPIDDARTQLSCSSPANDFDTGTCYLMDGLKWLFVGGTIMLGFYVLFRGR